MVLFEGHREFAGLCGSLLGLTTIAVSLRVFSRRKQQVPLLTDDYTVLVAYLSFIGTVCLCFWAIAHHHYGYAMPTNPQDIIPALKAQAKLAFSLDILSTISWGCIKISALMFYRRVFCVRKGFTVLNMWILSWVTIISMWIITYIILPPLQCGTHPDAEWTPSISAKYCGHAYGFILSQSVTDLALEVLVLATPIPSIIKLHTTVKRRFGILFIFLTAFVGLGACIARVYIYITFDNDAKDGMDLDEQKQNTTAMYFCVLETGLSLIAVNLPTLFFLRKHANPSKVMRSIRSAVSLRSNDSEKSSRRPSASIKSPKHTTGDSRSSTSVKSFVQDTDWRGEVHSMPVLTEEEKSALGANNKHGISVTRSVDQHFHGDSPV